MNKSVPSRRVLLTMFMLAGCTLSLAAASPSILLREQFHQIDENRWTLELPHGANARAKKGALRIKARGKHAKAILETSREWNRYELKMRFRIRSLRGQRNNFGVCIHSDSEGQPRYRYIASHHSIRGFGKRIRHARVSRKGVHTLRVAKTEGRITVSIDGRYALTHTEESGIGGPISLHIRRMHVDIEQLEVRENPEETAGLTVDFGGEGTPGPSWPDVAGPHHPDLSSPYPPGTQWRYFLRSWPHHTFKPNMDVTDDPHREEKANYSLSGPFSEKRRWYDFTVSTQTSGNLKREVAAGHAAGYETSPGFMEDLVPKMRESKKAAQDLIYSTVRFFNEKQPGGKPIRYWRFGLEMNGVQKNKPYLKEIDWKKHGRWYMNNSKETAHSYVRWLLAPGAAAVKKASEDVYGNSDRVKVVLGTVANLDNPGAVRFVRTILNRKLTKKDAPSLRGDRMWNHLDVVSANFFLHQTPWRDRLNWLHENYMEPGKIEGIWVTALGRSGNGAWHVLLTSARFLSWSCGKYNNPHALRLFFWGEDIDSPSGPGRLAVKYLADVFKDGSLLNYSDSVRIHGKPDVRPEAYALSSHVGRREKNHMLVCRTPAPLTLKRLSLTGIGNEFDPNSDDVSIRVWPSDSRPAGIEPESIQMKNETLIMKLDRNFQAGTQITCVIRTGGNG